MSVFQKLKPSGGVAQLGERTVRIRKVVGSNPIVSKKEACKTKGFTRFFFVWELACKQRVNDGSETKRKAKKKKQ